MVQVASKISRLISAAVIGIGLTVVVSGCDVAAALRHEDAVAQQTGNGTGSGTSTTEPGGQNWITGQTDVENCEWDGKTLTGIRAGRHDGFDRVVFDLSGDGAPCYRVFFDPNPLQDASGNPVSIPSGYQALRVEISALGPDFPTLPPAYTAQLSGNYISKVFFDTFFEGTATSFVVVPSGSTQYSVQVLPGKLIIDVRTNPAG